VVICCSTSTKLLIKWRIRRSIILSDPRLDQLWKFSLQFFFFFHHQFEYRLGVSSKCMCLASSLQLTACSPKITRHTLQRWYLRIVQYYTMDIYWPNPSMGKARKKFWATCFQTLKNWFRLVVMSKSISMSWTILPKKVLAKIFCSLGGLCPY
jgi:hypothetical protein